MNRIYPPRPLLIVQDDKPAPHVGFDVDAPLSPGELARTAATLPTQEEAEAYASRHFGGRKDLTYGDVAIRDRATGRRICFAGPAR